MKLYKFLVKKGSCKANDIVPLEEGVARNLVRQGIVEVHEAPKEIKKSPTKSLSGLGNKKSKGE